MRYNEFDIYMYDELNDSSHEKCLLNPNVTLEKLLIQYDLSTIPTVEIVLTTTLPQIYSDLQEIYIKIETREKIIEYNIGIVNAIYKPQKEVTLYGFLCKYDDIININSMYLDKTFIGCVKALDVKKYIRINGQDGYDEEFSEDFDFSYWKIQESNIQALHKILLGACTKSVYSMDNDTIYINTIDYNNTDAKYGSIAPDKILYISKSKKIDNYLNETEENKNVVNELDINSDLYYHTSMGKFYFGDSSTMSSMEYYTMSKPLIEYQGDILIKGIYEGRYIPFIIGNSMKGVKLNIDTSENWFIVSKVEKFSVDTGISTAILFSCKVKEE